MEINPPPAPPPIPTVPAALPVLKTVAAQVPDTKTYEDDVLKAVTDLCADADAKTVAIVDQPSYDAAVAAARACQRQKKQIEESMETQIVEPARKTWQGALKLVQALTGPLARRIAAADVATTAHRDREAAKARREAEERQAEERRQQKARDEAAAAATAARVQAEEDERLALALIAEESGDHARAAQLLDTPLPLPAAPAPIPPPPVPVPVAAAVARTEGEIRGLEWAGSVVDRRAFFLALAEERIPFHDEKGKPILEVREGWLNAMAKKHQDKMGERVPGTAAASTAKTSFRS